MNHVGIQPYSQVDLTVWANEIVVHERSPIDFETGAVLQEIVTAAASE